MAPVLAANCVWEGDGGSITPVELPDYNYALQSKGKYGTLCVVTRSPDGTRIACDDGQDMALDLGRDADGNTLMVLDGVPWAPRCD